MRRIKGSWLTAFDEWTLPRSEAPASMIHWAGMFTIASAIKRKVWVPRSLLGSYDITPCLYVVFVAKPGVVRKSTTAGYAEDLLRGLTKLMNGEKIRFAADVTSHSKLLGELAESPDNSITIIASELSNLLMTSKESMYEILTRLYDNKTNFDWGTWAHGDKTITNPAVNLLAATTPKWISTQPIEHFLGGGFASRVMFVYESQRRQYRMYYDDVDYTKIKALEKQLISDLNHITSIKGEFSHDKKSTRDYIEDWYQKHARKAADDERAQDFLERKHIHAHKLAMILSLSERDDRKITRPHWDEALQLLGDVEKQLPKAFTNLGQNPMGPQMDQVLEFVEEMGTATRQEIASRFYREIPTLMQIDSILSFLSVAGKLNQNGQAGNPKFTIKGAK